MPRGGGYAILAPGLFHQLSCLIIIFTILSIEHIVDIEQITSYLVLFMDPDKDNSNIRALNNYFFSFC